MSVFFSLLLPLYHSFFLVFDTYFLYDYLLSLHHQHQLKSSISTFFLSYPSVFVDNFSGAILLICVLRYFWAKILSFGYFQDFKFHQYYLWILCKINVSLRDEILNFIVRYLFSVIALKIAESQISFQVVLKFR